jgi:hypothetical protein
MQENFLMPFVCIFLGIRPGRIFLIASNEKIKKPFNNLKPEKLLNFFKIFNDFSNLKTPQKTFKPGFSFKFISADDFTIGKSTMDFIMLCNLFFPHNFTHFTHLHHNHHH